MYVFHIYQENYWDFYFLQECSWIYTGFSTDSFLKQFNSMWEFQFQLHELGNFKVY